MCWFQKQKSVFLRHKNVSKTLVFRCLWLLKWPTGLLNRFLVKKKGKKWKEIFTKKLSQMAIWKKEQG